MIPSNTVRQPLRWSDPLNRSRWTGDLGPVSFRACHRQQRLLDRCERTGRRVLGTRVLGRSDPGRLRTATGVIPRTNSRGTTTRPSARWLTSCSSRTAPEPLPSSSGPSQSWSFLGNDTPGHAARVCHAAVCAVDLEVVARPSERFPTFSDAPCATLRRSQVRVLAQRRLALAGRALVRTRRLALKRRFSPAQRRRSESRHPTSGRRWACRWQPNNR